MYFHLKKLLLCNTKKIIMKGTKGSETKALIRETAFKQFLTKDYSMVPLKDIEKSLNLSRGCTSYHYPTNRNCYRCHQRLYFRRAAGKTCVR